MDYTQLVTRSSKLDSQKQELGHARYMPALQVRRTLNRRRFYSASTNAIKYCIDLVREGDRERFLCNLHAPADARPGLFALHAFNFETARIRSTSGEAAARGRMTWWRNALASSLKGDPPDHPVAQAVAHATAHYPLTPRYLTQLLDAREADLQVQQPADQTELELYCERTAGSLLLLGLECAGVQECEAAEHAAFHVGAALGLATLLRGTAAHAAHGCTYLPAEMTTRHEVRLSAMLKGEATSAVCDAVAEVADEAVAHLLAARSMRPDVPAAACSVLLPATVAEHVLQRLRSNGYSPFAPGTSESLGMRLQFALLWKRMVGRY